MAIDWGQLGKQTMPTGGVVATLPNQPGNNVGDLGSGLMQGLAQGQAIVGQGIQNERNQLALGQEKQAVQDSNAIRAAAKDGEAAVLQEYANQGKIEAVQNYKNLQANYDQTMSAIALNAAQTEHAKAQTKILGPQVVEATQIAFGGIAQSAQAVAEKHGLEAAQKQYQFLLSNLSSEQQQIAKQAGYGEYSEPVVVKLTTGAMEAEANKREREEKEKMSDTKKVSTEMAKLQKKKKDGTLSEEDDMVLRNMEKAKDRSSMYRPANEEIGIKVATERLNKTNEDAKVHRSNLDTARLMKSIADSTDSGSLAKFKTNLYTAANSAFGIELPKSIPFNEGFNAIAKQFQVNAQSLMKGQTSDRDMKIMQELGPQLTNTAAGKRLMADIIEYSANTGLNRIAFENAWVAEHGSINSMDTAWDNFLQSRTDVKKTKTGYTFNKVNEKDWSPYINKDYQAPAQTTAPSTPESTEPNPELINAARQEAIRRGLIK